MQSHLAMKAGSKPHHFIRSDSAEQTLRAAEQFAEGLVPGNIILLEGDLGAGKTCFVKGVARHFGIPDSEVQSPTFSLIHEYTGSVPIYHLDCYRLRSSDEALQAGVGEYLRGEGICLIEWPETIRDLLPGGCYTIQLRHAGETTREITIHL